MKKKILLTLIIIGIISMIIIGLLFCRSETIKNIDYNIRKNLYGDPINLENGLINNNFFYINKEGKNAKQTTEGINDAIKYASDNNITNIQLEKGKYLINGEVDNTTYKDTKKGIILQSNINLDLNRFTINT